MDINLIARLNAQLNTNALSYGKHLHTISLFDDTNLVIVQIPLSTGEKISTVEEFKGLFEEIIDENLIAYPVVGNGAFGLTIMDGSLYIVYNYVDGSIDGDIFIPTQIKDKVL